MVSSWKKKRQQHSFMCWFLVQFTKQSKRSKIQCQSHQKQRPVGKFLSKLFHFFLSRFIFFERLLEFLLALFVGLWNADVFEAPFLFWSFNRCGALLGLWSSAHSTH